MDPIESWVDVSELRRMADALLIGNVGAAEPEEEPEEPSFGTQFEGFLSLIHISEPTRP